MDYTLKISLSCTLAHAVRGLRSVTDEGDELLTILEHASVVRAITVPMRRADAAATAAAVAEAVTDARVAATLAEVGGNVTEASRRLGVARSTVRAAVKRHRAGLRGMTVTLDPPAAPANDTTAPGGARRTG